MSDDSDTDSDAGTNTDTGVENVPSNRHKDTINVHRDVLCQTSEFFAKATKGEWCELREDPDTITLKGDDLEVVKAYVRWLYRQDPPLPLLNSSVVNVYPFLAKAYVFGEKVIDTTFKDAVIDCIVARAVETKSFPTSQTMNIIYRGTLDGSPARRLMVDFCVDGAYVRPEYDAWVQSIRGFSKELLADVVVGMVQKRPSLNKNPWTGASHLYHEGKKG